MTDKRRKIRNIAIATGSVVAAGTLFLAASITTINSGQVGVKVRFGKAVDVPVSEGINFKIPLIERIVKMNLKVQKAQVETSSSSKDLQEVDMTLAVNYRINFDDAIELYKTVGMNYDQVILQPAIEESIKAVTSRYTAEQLITRRSEVSNECMEELSKKVSKYGINVSDFNITNFSFSEEFDRAIEEKQVAEQKVLTAKQELEKEKIEAEKIVVAAEAEKKANELKAESYTPEILLNNGLETWDGHMSESITIVLGNDTGFGLTKMVQ